MLPALITPSAAGTPPHPRFDSAALNLPSRSGASRPGIAVLAASVSVPSSSQRLARSPLATRCDLCAPTEVGLRICSRPSSASSISISGTFYRPRQHLTLLQASTALRFLRARRRRGFVHRRALRLEVDNHVCGSAAVVAGPIRRRPRLPSFRPAGSRSVAAALA